MTDREPPPLRHYVQPLAELVHGDTSIKRRRAHWQVWMTGESTKRCGLRSLVTPKLEIAAIEVMNDQAAHANRVVERRLSNDVAQLLDDYIDLIRGELALVGQPARFRNEAVRGHPHRA